jgi:flagellar hook protein FlgE
MDVIGNNIANVNTIGYKSSRTIFQDIFSQTSRGGSANQGDLVGGTNPVQIGLGIMLSTIDVLHTQSAFNRTDNPFDMMLNGDGYFIVQGPEGNFYTRAGNFKLDEEGYLTNSDGYYVLGYSNTNLFVVEEVWWYFEDPTSPEDGEVRGYVPPRYSIKSFATDPTSGDLSLGAGEGGENIVRPELDTSQLSKIQFKVLNFAVDDGLEVDAFGEPDTDALSTEALRTWTGWIPYDPEETGIYFNADGSEAYPEGKPPFPGVDLLGFSVSNSGEVSAMINNVSTVVAQLVIGMFSNPGGLEKAGNSLYRESPSSGAVVLTTAQMNGAGAVMGGGLEMSNVDLASEFTDMIVTQRGFQANSRIITVSDTMLEELVNLKR